MLACGSSPVWWHHEVEEGGEQLRQPSMDQLGRLLARGGRGPVELLLVNKLVGYSFLLQRALKCLISG